jgi:two-component system OmpR family response regulator
MTSSRRILIVEDNIDTAITLALLCDCWGHEVAQARDGRAAVAVATDFEPDAIVLDVGLPYLDGFQVAERLRRLPQFRRTLIIAISGYGEERDRRRALEAGIDLYLVKPFDPWRLEEIFADCGSQEALPA